MPTLQANTGAPILVVGPAWVGDMVMAQSLFKVLKRQHPDAPLDVLAPAWSLELLERMPEVRHGVGLDVGHGEVGLWSRYRVGRALRGRGYRQAIVLPNSFKSALVPYWARIPQRTGYVGEFRYPLLNDWRELDKALLTRTVDRFVALAYPKHTGLPPHLPHPRLESADHLARRALRRLDLEYPDAPVLALCPGAEYGPAKRWSEAYFAEVAKHKLAQGWRVWLFGSEKDMAVGAAISHLSGGQALNLCGKTRLGEAVDLLGLATAVVSNDSGLMHVAAALDRPLVAIYGSSDPDFTPPLSKHAQVLRLGLPCSPCFKRDCPYAHTDCLRRLEPAQVIEALERN